MNFVRRDKIERMYMYKISLASQTLALCSIYFFQDKHAEVGSGPLPISVWIQPDKMLSGQSNFGKCDYVTLNS